MAVEITMPKLSQTTDEVRLIRWLVREGETVNKGGPLCEVENDKTTMEVESFACGTVLSLFGEPGSMVAAGTLIAVLGEPGEKTGNAEKQSVVLSGEANVENVPGEQTSSELTAVSRLGPLPSGINASRLVQNIALKKGIDLSRVTGSGPGGRITKMDLETFQSAGTQSVSVAVTAEEPAFPGAYALSESQKMLGRNLQASKTRIPHYYLKTNLLCDRLLAWRQSKPRPDDSRVSINAILVFAAARALKRFPRLNAFFREDRLMLNPEINIGLAVAVGEELYVPVVRNVGEKGIHEIDRDLKRLVSKTQNGCLESEDLRGGTFTVTNLGMFPVDEFTAIISPPQVGILAFGRIGKDVIVDEQDSMRIRSTCVVTGSFDHRVINGAQGAAFIAELKKIIEEEL